MSCGACDILKAKRLFEEKKARIRAQEEAAAKATVVQSVIYNIEPDEVGAIEPKTEEVLVVNSSEEKMDDGAVETQPVRKPRARKKAQPVVEEPALESSAE